ncbi:MAG: M28 family peptidase [Thermoguttaceae bacterium]
MHWTSGKMETGLQLARVCSPRGLAAKACHMTQQPHTARRLRTGMLLLAASTLIGGLAIAFWLWPKGDAAGSTLSLEQIPFDGARAYGYLKQLCAIGPRRSGSAGMRTQQRLLAEHFQKLGGVVEFQQFRARDPRDNSWVPMANLVVRWHPRSAERILLCAHYDTLPYPLEDRTDPHGTFVGANDNASGVALLMELAHDLLKLGGKYGVDFVLLDGEEYIFRPREPMYLGASFFAQQYAKQQAAEHPAYRYRWGVLLDMVGAADLKLPIEGNSAWWRETRPLVNEIWSTAARLGVGEFLPRKAGEIEDDHIELYSTGRIPCIDIIQQLDDYPPWHTRQDTPEQCSPLSLAKVGWVIREWIKTAR